MAKKMDSKLESVLQKVRGLLALSGNNPSQAEAQAAALKAQELIAKYNLTLTEVEKETQEIVTSEYKTGVDKSWKYGLARAVADNFRVMIYWVDRRVAVFYGYKQDTMIAVQVFEYLFKTGERGARAACRKAYKENGTETGVYFSYTRGFTAGVKAALDAQSTALMVITPKEVKTSYEAYAAENLKQLPQMRNGSEKGTSRAAYNDGFRDGKSSAERRGLENTKITG